MTVLTFSAEQIRWHRFVRNGLLAPFADAATVCIELVGVQAQILPAAGLALWNRAPRVSALRLEQELYATRSLLKLWGQRGTLHLYHSADWPLIYAMQSDLKTYWERKMLREGGDLREYHALVEALAVLLREQGTLGRSDLRRSGLALNDDHLSGWGGIFAVLVRRGLACHAEPRNGEARVAAREHWLPDLAWNPPDAHTANVALLRRYLAAYGPATLKDMAYWRGRALGETARWVQALGDEVTTLVCEGVPMLALRETLPDPSVVPPARDGWPVRLLGRFDPLLLGVQSKDWLVDSTFYQRVWRPAGHIEATLLVGGRIAGTWRYDRRGGGLLITVEPFQTPPAYVRKAVERQARGVAAHFATPLVELVWSMP
jgi:hypothetical protein